MSNSWLLQAEELKFLTLVQEMSTSFETVHFNKFVDYTKKESEIQKLYTSGVLMILPRDHISAP